MKRLQRWWATWVLRCDVHLCSTGLVDEVNARLDHGMRARMCTDCLLAFVMLDTLRRHRNAELGQRDGSGVPPDALPH